MAYAGKTLARFSILNARTLRREHYRLVMIKAPNSRALKEWYGPYLYRIRDGKETYIGRIDSPAAARKLWIRDIMQMNAQRERNQRTEDIPY